MGITAAIKPMSINEELFRAISELEPDKVSRLLTQGANANATDCRRRRPLHNAFSPFNESRENAVLQVVRILVLAGADINAPDDYNRGMTPLMQAAACRFPQVVHWLLGQGANAEVKVGGRTVFEMIRARDDYGFNLVMQVLVRGTRDGRAWFSTTTGQEWARSTGFKM